MRTDGSRLPITKTGAQLTTLTRCRSPCLWPSPSTAATRSIHSCGAFCPTTKWWSAGGRENSMSRRGMLSAFSALSAKTAPEPSSSYSQNVLTLFLGSSPRRLNGSMKPPSRCACAPCVRITPRGASRGTQVSSALPAHNRKPRFYLKTEDGVSLRAAFPRHTSSSRPQVHSTAIPKTNISASNWCARSDFL